MQEVREVLKVGLAQLRNQLRHHRIAVADAHADLVVAQRLEEVVLALVGKARHVFTPGVIRLMAGAAALLRCKRAAAREARGIASTLWHGRRRQRAERITKRTQFL